MRTLPPKAKIAAEVWSGLKRPKLSSGQSVPEGAVLAAIGDIFDERRLPSHNGPQEQVGVKLEPKVDRT